MTSIYQIIEQSKIRAGQALAEAFDQIAHSAFTEQDLAQRWLQAIRNNSDFYDGGWYDPPPQGIISLFGKATDDFDRICQPSFRPEPMWPSIHKYDPEDIIVVYASPMHRHTKLIGDFGLNLYRGSNAQIIDHFENVLQATVHIAAQTKVGMPFKEVYAMGMEYGMAQGFENNITSSSDKTGTNVGHTIPLSYASDATHTTIAQAKDFSEIRNAISKGRKFLNAQEDQCVEANMAFTVEPRFSTAKMPNTWFHLTVILKMAIDAFVMGLSLYCANFL